MGRHEVHGRQESGEDSQEDQHHLLHIGPGYRLHAAGNGIGEHNPGHDQHRGALAPTQNHRHHYGRSVERQSHAESALDEKHDARRHAGLGVEALLQKFVGRDDARAVKKRDHGRRQNHHRQRQPEVELHEAHAVDISLPSGSDKGDGAGLRRHDGKTHGPPGHGFARQKIIPDGLFPAALVQSVADDHDQGEYQDNPVQQSHWGS